MAISSRGRAWAAVAAAVLIAGGAIIAAMVYRTDDAGSSSSPTAVVSDYLRALAAGDAQAALSLGAATPHATTLLTSEVLKQQLDKLPITDIRVDGEQPTPATRPDRVYVKAAAAFGNKHSEGLIQVVRTATSWKLASAFLALQPTPAGHPSVYDTMTVFGHRVDPGVLDVFPGALAVSTSNEFLATESQPEPVLLERLRYGEQPNSFTVAFAINHRGRQAIQTAVIAWLTACMTAGSPPAGPCTKIDTSISMGGMAVPGTTRLTGPISLGQFTINFDQTLRPVAVVNNATVPMVAQRPDGSTVTGNFAGFTTPVDISKTPPVVVAP
ncbi:MULTISPECIES: hypothetical protein [unclassified Mycobacterium]|uniref:hypothetical protein n=1 Tax=unclassified Mycobacterium TaxID=2642494 RepID=UPI0012E962CD|nr:MULTISPECIES: hypothetical protein [unclassified Mycobacterium]